MAVRPPGLVALFTGATRGIRAETLQELLTHLKSPKIYVVGRDASKFARDLSELRALNPEAHIEFLEANVSLLREIDRVADSMLAAEHHLDLLCMSRGHFPTGGPSYTEDGIDQCVTLSFYGRLRLTNKLLPLSQKASQPWVLSILAGGAEKRLWRDDLDLSDHYSLFNAMDELTSLTMLALARLATLHPSITFVHSHPGLVGIDIMSNSLTTERLGILGAIAQFLVSSVVVPIFRGFVATTPRESGERFAFQLTSERYTSPDKRKADGLKPLFQELEIVNGLYLLNKDGEMKVNEGLLQKWMTDGSVDQVWEHTMSMLEGRKRP